MRTAEEVLAFVEAELAKSRAAGVAYEEYLRRTWAKPSATSFNVNSATTNALELVLAFIKSA